MQQLQQLKQNTDHLGNDANNFGGFVIIKTDKISADKKNKRKWSFINTFLSFLFYSFLSFTFLFLLLFWWINNCSSLTLDVLLVHSFTLLIDWLINLFISQILKTLIIRVFIWHIKWCFIYVQISYHLIKSLSFCHFHFP